ncbi:flavin reductase family protein [Actinomadura sp. 9N215]|uniref:flavin reductase family protein n=1 Tax=Actinomadura sp. 9N215 TaxID=3375150 RepID=UPI0037B31E6A
MTIGGHLPARTLTSVIPMMGETADAGGFRDAMGSFPTPVTVVTALDEDGLPRGLTCSAVASLSMDPPSLLVCVNRRNGSLRAIRHSGGFVVNLLREGRYRLSDRFASASPSKFAGTPWRPSTPSGLPLLHADVLAHVDCALQAELVAGSHVILIGLVRSAGSTARDGGPLVYYNRSYGRWALPVSEDSREDG